MPSIGYATLQVIPSVRGIGDELRRQLVGPAGNAGGQAGDAAGSSLKDKLKVGAAAAGVAAGALLVAGLTEAIDQANVKSKLQAQLGTSNKVADQQGKLAGKLYASGVSDSFQDAADAIKSVVTAGLAPPDATNKQLQSIATKASDVASVFDQDLGGVTNAVSQLMRTGLAKNSTQAFDLITKGFQSGADKAGDFLDTLNEYGTQFRKLGITGPAAVGLINQGLKAGARDGDLVADAIKEFSIRAVDGSKTSAAGFKGLGLSAKGMAEQIGKGGKGASDGLDTVLTKLRAVKDPVTQAGLATDLFGTQSEDLGKALFALDPSKAAAGLGKFGGAADKVGKTIRTGPSYELKTFTRTLKQGFVTFLGGQVLPILTRVATVFNSRLLPPIKVVAGVLATLFLPTLSALGRALSSTVGWLKEWGIWLVPLGIAIVGLTIAMNTQAIATAFVTGVFAVYRAAVLIGTTVTNGFAGAQALLSAVMEANPIVLIVTLIIALGVALVIAYKKSDTFRAIVQGAWAGIQKAAMAAWSFIKPVIDGFMVGLRAVGSAAVWLWSKVLAPAFSFIGTAAKILATILVVLVVAPIIASFKLLAAVGTWLWKNALGPALRAIGAVAGWLYTKVIKPNIALAVAAFHALGAAGTWLWKNAISPALHGIATLAGWLYTHVIKPNVAFVVTAFHALGTAGSWLYKNAISPAFHGIATVAKWLYDKGIKPPIEAGKKAAHALGTAFTAAKNVIGDQFSKIANLAKKPISFVIDTVYNKGIVGVWNKVAGAFGAPKLSKFKGFATGGAVHGPGTETSDSILTRLSANEHVWSAKEVRGAGGHGAVMALRQQAKAGRLALPGFKDGGGLFGWIGSAGSALKGMGSAAWDKVKKSASWLKDTIAGSARAGINALVRPLVSAIPGQGGGFGRMAKGIPNRMIDALFGYAKKSDDKGGSASLANIGGSGVSRWSPYVVKALAANHLSTSASMVARVLRQISSESGGNPNAVQGNIGDINNRTGDLAKGLMQTISATFNHYKFPGHGNIFNGFDNLLAALNYAKHAYGPSLSFLGHGHGYDAGGWLMPGSTMAVNKTGRPEAVLTATQWQAMAAQAAAARAATSAAPTASQASRFSSSGLDGLTLKVFVGSEELSHIARTEVYKATGELVQVLDAGGGH